MCTEKKKIHAQKTKEQIIKNKKKTKHTNKHTQTFSASWSDNVFWNKNCETWNQNNNEMSNHQWLCANCQCYEGENYTSRCKNTGPNFILRKLPGHFGNWVYRKNVLHLQLPDHRLVLDHIFCSRKIHFQQDLKEHKTTDSICKLEGTKGYRLQAVSLKRSFVNGGKVLVQINSPSCNASFSN